MSNIFVNDDPSCPLTPESINKIIVHNPQLPEGVQDLFRRTLWVLKPDLADILANTPDLTEEEKQWLISTALNVVERDERGSWEPRPKV